MNTPRCLFVTPRFGDFAGGAEALIRGLATRMHHDNVITSEVATTCALDHHTWANVLDFGTEVIEGIPVHRFPIDPPTVARTAVPPGLEPTADLEWAAGTMFSSRMEEWMRRNAHGFDAIFAAPYLFGTTIWTALTHPEKTILIPCLHDEPDAYSTTVGKMLRGARSCFFNTVPEWDLARQIHGISQGHLVGYGPGTPPVAAASTTDLTHLELPERYVAYCGRLEDGKGVNRLIETVQIVNSDTEEPITLVLMGTGPASIPDDPHFVTLGFVDEATKYAVFAGAIANTNFSRLESLSIVIQESWLVGTPCIVDAQSPVMRWQAERSQGGIAVNSPNEFAAAVRRLETERDRYGAAGRTFTEAEYSPDAIRSRFSAALHATLLS